MSGATTTAQQTVDSGARRPPFARLLRHWRMSRKLSQLELAMVSEISQRHLSFLELGRAKPSRDMVLRLGDALELPLRGQNALLGAAGFAPHFRESALDAHAMKPVLGALRLMLRHHEPNPAVVIDRCWNLLMVNDAMQRVFGLLGDAEAIWAAVCGDGPRNLFKVLFHPQGTRSAVANWDVVAPVMLSRTRRAESGFAGPVGRCAGLPRHSRGLASRSIAGRGSSAGDSVGAGARRSANLAVLGDLHLRHAG